MGANLELEGLDIGCWLTGAEFCWLLVVVVFRGSQRPRVGGEGFD